MVRKVLFLFVLFAVFSAFAVCAEEGGREDLWLAAAAEMNIYGIDSPAFGGGLVFGYGTGTSIGIKTAWFISTEGIGTMEICFLFRYYLQGISSFSGPFLQLTAGTAIFSRSGETLAIHSELGAFSIGFNFGWRFLFGRWYVEPAVRAGYPYILGLGAYAGIRF